MSSTPLSKHLQFFDTLGTALVGIVFVLVPFHAFLTVWASTLVGHFVLLRLWDDGLLAALCLIALTWLYIYPELRSRVYHNGLLGFVALYLAIVIVWAIVTAWRHAVTSKALAYGLLIDVRIVLWFAVCWLAAQRNNFLIRSWPKFIFWPLAVVAAFAVLQFTVLPHTFLAHFGYNKTMTFVPYTTLNQDSATIRTQSFLRGPNPLGGYFVIGLSLVAAYFFRRKDRRWLFGLLGAASAFALFTSFSRSAWIGTVVALALLAYLSLRSRGSAPLYWVIIGGFLLISISFLGVARHSSGVQDALFHVSDHSTAQTTSNASHLSAASQSLDDIRHQPLGEGPGSAGQASWYNEGKIRNTESLFLQFGEEYGWLGLGSFVVIVVLLGRELVRRRNTVLGAGLLAALCGLIVVNLLSYGWADDTLAFVFWGLAGICLGQPSTEKKTPLSE